MRGLRALRHWPQNLETNSDLPMKKSDRIKRARTAGLAAAAVGASQRNGRLGAPHGYKGGRPGNPEIKRIMHERGVSRQRAHQILSGWDHIAAVQS